MISNPLYVIVGIMFILYTMYAGLELDKSNVFIIGIPLIFFGFLGSYMLKKGINIDLVLLEKNKKNTKRRI